MMNFLTTPIFFLTPYIFLWSIFNGLLTIGLLQLLKFKTSRLTKLATALTTAIGSMLWNWSIEFNQSTVHLNGVCVFALTSLVLGLWVNPQGQATTVAKIAGIAALLTIFTDTFFF
jgi:hypothetical protein